jgi:hypothetical protein
MIKRILAAIGTDRTCRGALAWSLDIARCSGAEVTVVPMLDPQSWKESLPSVMTAGYAARLLERRPWEDTPVRMHDLQAWCLHMCAEAGVECSVREPVHDPLDWVARLSLAHDLLVFSGQVNAVADLTGRGLGPVLVVPNETNRIEAVLVVYSGSLGSARTVKQYVQMRLWPAAPLELVCAHGDPEEAEALLSDTARYCRAHGYDVRLTHIEGDTSHLLDYVGRIGASLVVTADSDPQFLSANLPVFMSH